MVDLILLLFFIATFAGGFWVGQTFGTLKAAAARAVSWIGGLFQ